MSEFPSIETLTAAKNAVERDRVIRETWEALVAAVEELARLQPEADRLKKEFEEMPAPDIFGDPYYDEYYDRYDESVYAERDCWCIREAITEKAIAYVKARKGNE